MTRTTLPGSMWTAVELAALVREMRSVADHTYTLFFTAGMGGKCHAFIEFNGLIGKYVDICQRAAAEGVDFTQASAHSGVALPCAVHDMEYLGEKLACIFGPALDSNPDAAAALKKALFGEP